MATSFGPRHPAHPIHARRPGLTWNPPPISQAPIKTPCIALPPAASPGFFCGTSGYLDACGRPESLQIKKQADAGASLGGYSDGV